MSGKRIFARNIGSITLTAFAMVLVSANVHAAAFAVRDQSATYTGNAYAGTSSLVQDASTSYYNPAGLKYLDRNQMVLSTVYTDRSIKLYNATARSNANLAVTGINPSKPSASEWTPGLNLAMQLGNRFALGFSIVELFSSNLKYESNSIARYSALNTVISTIDISPSLGVMIIPDTLYIGAALDYMKTNTEISSAVGWGGGRESLGYVETYMNDWNYGYHLGILFKCNECMRMGLVYFSKFTPNLSGGVTQLRTLDFGSPTKVTSEVTFPERVNYSITLSVPYYLDVMAEVEWTRWSRLKNMLFRYDSNAIPGYINFNFDNSWRFSLGMDAHLSHMFTFKCGLAYDQTPVNNNFKNIRVPENNGYIFGVGLVYNFNDWLSLVGSYNHVLMQSFDITQTSATESLNQSPNINSGTFLNGKIKNSINRVGIQIVLSVPDC